MAWTTPKTFSADAALTASELNTYLRDNQDWLKDALTTHGIESDSVVQVLKGARYGCSAYTESFTASDQEDRSVPFTTGEEEWDDAGFHNDTYQSRFTVPTAGTYECKLWVQFAANGTGVRQAWFEKNGADEYNRIRIATASSSVTTNIYVSVELELAANDYIIHRVRQNSGSSLDCRARASIRRIAVS